MIEELESRVLKEKMSKEVRQISGTQREFAHQEILVSLEDRVQELNKTNCYLEKTLLACQTDLEATKLKLGDYDRMKMKESHHASNLQMISHS
jgi:hypothetical protein